MPWPYEEIAEVLKARILNGDYEPGDKLPSVLDLRDDPEIHGAENTIKHALSELEEGRWIDIKPRQGTYVCKPLRPRPTLAARVTRIEEHLGLPPIDDQAATKESGQ